jgi:hypothetical protein
MRLLVNSFMNACQKFSMRFFHCVSFPFLHLARFAFLARLFLFFAAAFPAWGRTDERTHTRGKNVVSSVDRFGGLFLHTNNRGCASPPCMLFALLLICTDFAACDSLLLSSSLTARRPSFCYITILPSLPRFPPVNILPSHTFLPSPFEYIQLIACLNKLSHWNCMRKLSHRICMRKLSHRLCMRKQKNTTTR